MRNVIRILLIGLLLLAFRSVDASSNNRFKIESVTFEGNHTFSDARLLRLMISRPSAFLSRSYYYPEILADDLDNVILFYQQNGYLDAAIVDTGMIADSAASTIDIRISINEGELTRLEGLSVFGNEVFSDSVLLKTVSLKVGDSFKRNAIQDGMLAMLNMYAENGYLEAVIKPEIKINSEAHLAVVDFAVSERQQCFISNIIIQGAEKTRPGVIRRELLFQQDDVIRYSRLVQSQRRLYLTGLFQSVFIRPEPPANGDSTRRDILVEIKDNLSSEFNFLVGYGSVEKVRTRVELLTSNLAGTARKVGVNLDANFIRRAAEASFTEPWTFGTRWRTDLNLLYEYLEEPGYNLARRGGRLTVGRSLRGNANISLTYRYEDATLRHLELAVPPDDLDTRIRSLTVSATKDSRDNLFDTRRGTYAEWSNELAGAFLHGTDTFIRSVARFKWFSSPSRYLTLGSSVEIGWMDHFGETSVIPLSERFYAGGPNSIRGFEYQKVGPLDENGVPVGGRFKIVWNALELRRAVYKMIGVVAFVDVGNVWSRVADFKVKDLRTSVGTGLRVNTPIGIVRLDYGINPDRIGDEPRSRLYFNMGHAF